MGGDAVDSGPSVRHVLCVAGDLFFGAFHTWPKASLSVVMDPGVPRESMDSPAHLGNPEISVRSRAGDETVASYV